MFVEDERTVETKGESRCHDNSAVAQQYAPGETRLNACSPSSSVRIIVYHVTDLGQRSSRNCGSAASRDWPLRHPELFWENSALRISPFEPRHQTSSRATKNDEIR